MSLLNNLYAVPFIGLLLAAKATAQTGGALPADVAASIDEVMP